MYLRSRHVLCCAMFSLLNAVVALTVSYVVKEKFQAHFYL
jgi:hypothetical protein